MSTPDQSESTLAILRREFHERLFLNCVRMRLEGVPNMADKDSVPSAGLAKEMTARIGLPIVTGTVTPQRVGSSSPWQK